MKAWQMTTAIGLLAFLLLLGGASAYYLQRPIGEASVPASSIPSGWQDSGASTESVAGGIVKLRIQNYQASELGKVALAVITPLPFVDLTQRVDDQVQRILEENQARSTPSRSGNLEIVGLTVPFQEFSVEANDGSWNGKLLRATFRCPESKDFVASIGFGVTDKLGLFRKTYEEAQQMVEATRCE